LKIIDCKPAITIQEEDSARKRGSGINGANYPSGNGLFVRLRRGSSMKNVHVSCVRSAFCLLLALPSNKVLISGRTRAIKKFNFLKEYLQVGKEENPRWIMGKIIAFTSSLDLFHICRNIRNR
jgi:hypothetical protein